MQEKHEKTGKQDHQAEQEHMQKPQIWGNPIK